MLIKGTIHKGFLTILLSTSLCAIAQVESNLIFSDDEISYLNSLGTINYCVDPAWPPYDYITSDGSHDGILSDYMGLLSQRLKIPLNLVNTSTYTESRQKLGEGACQIISGDVFTLENKKMFLGTDVYFSTPRAFAIHADEPFVNDFKDIVAKRIGAQAESPALSIIPALYPESGNIVPIGNIKEGIQLVASGELDVFISSFAGLAHNIREQALTSVKIGGVISSEIEFSILVNKNNPQLVGILNKALSSITDREKIEIFDKWISVEYVEGFNYTLLWQVLAVVILFVVFTFYRNYQLSRFNSSLNEAHQMLEIANSKLAETIAELEDKNNELELISTTDKLTGLTNRNKLDEVFDQELKKFERYQSEFSIIMTDVDHFKSINDNHGHMIGDEILVQFASLLKENTRDIDVVGRWGGEEFLLLCPGSKLEDSMQLAEKLRMLIQENVYAGDLKITSSFGVTEVANKDDANLMMKRADSALYQAKSQGRNQVCKG